MTPYPYIAEVAAITSLAESWEGTWDGLMRGERSLTNTQAIDGFEATSALVAAVCNLDRNLTDEGVGPSGRLLSAVLANMFSNTNVQLYGGSNHAEAELLRRLLSGATKGQAVALLDEHLAVTSFGVSNWTYAACTSGLHALVAAAYDFREGDVLADAEALVFSADALSLVETLGFARSGALSPDGARPFADDRNGLTIGEGAVCARLTSFPSADGIAILGIGMSCDGYHPTDPCPTGEHLERAICMALSDAKLAPSDVVTVVGHGTGTAKGDRIESDVLQRIWGSALPTVTSVKGHVGHLMGAAGLFNLAVGFEACRTGFVPKTRGEVPKTVSCEKGRPTLCLASGFGGNNVALLIGRRSR